MRVADYPTIQDYVGECIMDTNASRALALQMAQALDQLQTLGLTHRAIRPDNLFVAAGGKAVVLGPGWGAPPAMHQPALFEPPYSAL